MDGLIGGVAQEVKVAINNLRFYFGTFEALKGVSFQIPARQVTAIIGPSGCGKSTLLRCLNRIYAMYPDRHAEGEVWIDGRDILREPETKLDQLRRRVGMVFQQPTPFPMSVYENIAFGIRLWEKLPHSELNDRIEHELRRAALWDEVKDKLRKRATTLSGGQQQRLCIARAIAMNPEVLLLDEPCSALDPISTGHIERLIEALKQEFCVVIVTHNLQQAARISDYTAFMLLGELIEHDTAEQIFENPKDPA